METSKRGWKRKIGWSFFLQQVTDIFVSFCGCLRDCKQCVKKVANFCAANHTFFALMANFKRIVWYFRLKFCKKVLIYLHFGWYEKVAATTRSSRSQVFIKICNPKNFAIFTRKHLCWSLFLIKLQAFGPEEHPKTAASIAPINGK